MKYKIICHIHGTKLKVRSAKRYLGKDKDGYNEPTTDIVVEQCPDCLAAERDKAHSKSYCSPKHGW